MTQTLTLFYLDEQPVYALPGETVLDALIRHGHEMGHSCTPGNCQACLLKHLDGPLPPAGQIGLPPTLKQQGMVLACNCPARANMHLVSNIEQQLYRARLVQRHSLNDDVSRFVFAAPPGYAFQPGQCVSIRNPAGVSRSYAIASGDDTNSFSLHIRRKPNGLFSSWLHEILSPGDEIQLTEPWGRCRYRSAYGQDELLIFAFDTGIGAAVAMVEEALARGHEADIYLYHWGRSREDLYLHKPLLELMLRERRFYYQGLISNQGDCDRIDHKRIQLREATEVLAQKIRVSRWQRLFLFGDPGMVAKMAITPRLRLLGMDRVHRVSFDYRDLRRLPR